MTTLDIVLSLYAFVSVCVLVVGLLITGVESDARIGGTLLRTWAWVVLLALVWPLTAGFYLFGVVQGIGQRTWHGLYHLPQDVLALTWGAYRHARVDTTHPAERLASHTLLTSGQDVDSDLKYEDVRGRFT